MTYLAFMHEINIEMLDLPSLDMHALSVYNQLNDIGHTETRCQLGCVHNNGKVLERVVNFSAQFYRRRLGFQIYLLRAHI